MWGNIRGAHLTLWGRRVILPPPYATSKNLTIIHFASDFNSKLIKRIKTRLMRYVLNVLYVCTIHCINFTFVSIAFIISNQLLRNTSLTTTT